MDGLSQSADCLLCLGLVEKMENTYNVGSLSLDSHALTKHVTKRKYNGLCLHFYIEK